MEIIMKGLNKIYKRVCGLHFIILFKLDNCPLGYLILNSIHFL